ncbi:MAG: ACT domain-containing protein [Acidobacteria bacterium]|nr:ACT domain-containing protein [Candidatus Sulfomarinibacter kjeldsenii]
MTRTNDELSIVSPSTDVPSGSQVEDGWRCLRVEGPLAFEMTGVLAELSAPLARAEIPIFVVSTYDTDYLLVKATDLERASSTLRNEGHTVRV